MCQPRWGRRCECKSGGSEQVLLLLLVPKQLHNLVAARLIKKPEEHGSRPTCKLAAVQRGWGNSEGLHELQRGAVPRACALQRGKLRHAGLSHAHCLALVCCLPSRCCNLLKKKTRGYTSCCSSQLQPFPGARTGRNLAWEANIPAASPGCRNLSSLSSEH